MTLTVCAASVRLAALKEVGYDGYLGIECGVSGPYDEALAESAALLRELWEAA